MPSQMALTVEVYETKHVPAAIDFNRRVVAGGGYPGFLLAVNPHAFNPGLLVSVEARVAVDGEFVRGGYLLQWRDFWINGTRRRVCALQSPISEGIINRHYAGIGILMVRHALSVNPRLYGVGMGGTERSLPRMLRSLGFSVGTVPFWFRVNRVGPFLRHIEHLRSSRKIRAVIDLARFTGLGWLGVRGLQLLKSPWRHDRSVQSATLDSLDTVADEIWDLSKNDYRCLGVRDSAMLSLLYPSDEPKYTRIRVYRRDRNIGWAVLVEKQMQGNKYFGDMRVGVVADCLARPGDAGLVVHEAARHLAEHGADITVANFQHPAWIDGCRRAGFFAGPSRHVLALSRTLVDDLSPVEINLAETVHISRGDSDGLANL
jgi:hypothetical protein